MSACISMDIDGEHFLPLRLDQESSNLGRYSVIWQDIWGLKWRCPWKSGSISPDGVNEKTIRDVSENCHALRFETFGFEEE